jgi:hypothetical protein
MQSLREIPEAMKPRRIAINGSPASNVQQLEPRRPDRQRSVDINSLRGGRAPRRPDAWTRCILRLAAR